MNNNDNTGVNPINSNNSIINDHNNHINHNNDHYNNFYNLNYVNHLNNVNIYNMSLYTHNLVMHNNSLITQNKMLLNRISTLEREKKRSRYQRSYKPYYRNYHSRHMNNYRDNYHTNNNYGRYERHHRYDRFNEYNRVNRHYKANDRCFSNRERLNNNGRPRSTSMYGDSNNKFDLLPKSIFVSSQKDKRDANRDKYKEDQNSKSSGINEVLKHLLDSTKTQNDEMIFTIGPSTTSTSSFFTFFDDPKLSLTGDDKDKDKNKNNKIKKKTPNLKNVKLIKNEIKSIDDLLDLGKIYEKEKKDKKINNYAIDLKRIYDIKDILIKLKNMIGMESVKTWIVEFILYVLQDYESEHMYHTIITGPPGVGKTELGHIICNILSKMKVLKEDKFIHVKRADLIGEYLGQTTAKTQRIFDKANGGMLFIDEAYSLGNSEKRDSYSKECIDCINQNLSENKNNIIVVIAGYEDQLEKCFFSHNPGLKRRFPFKFSINEYSHDELKNIFIKKINDEGWKINLTNSDKTKLSNLFKDNHKVFSNFGGDIETMFLQCKLSHSSRMINEHPKLKKTLTFDDIKSGYDNFHLHKINNNDFNKNDNPMAHMYT